MKAERALTWQAPQWHPNQAFTSNTTSIPWPITSALVMQADLPYRKLVKHYDEPGHIHELTFSCYQRRKLLSNDSWRSMLAESLQNATVRHRFRLLAFVFMPEHVHLLLWPEHPDAKISPLLKAIKQPFSNRIRQLLEQNQSGLLHTLTVQERPGKMAFRFWQEGGGYDRNFTEPSAVQSALDYIHMNPVRRGLVEKPELWKWSSYGYYLSDAASYDQRLPLITPMPAAFWDE